MEVRQFEVPESSFPLVQMVVMGNLAKLLDKAGFQIVVNLGSLSAKNPRLAIRWCSAYSSPPQAFFRETP